MNDYTDYIVRETGYPGAIKQECIGELIRCAECKHWNKEEHYCPEFMTQDENGFCSWAERREDAEKA